MVDQLGDLKLLILLGGIGIGLSRKSWPLLALCRKSKAALLVR
jgi:hypothetical protein